MNYQAEDTDPLKKQMIRAGAFNPDDLIFNQAGELSPRQKRWLFINLSFWMILTGCNLAVLIVVWLFFYLQNNFPLFCAGSLFWGVMLGITILTCITHALSIWNDIKNNEVIALTGTISKHFSAVLFGNNMKHTGGYCSLEIRGHTFNVINPFVYTAIANHQTYRLFYTPNTKKIINIEPLFRLDIKKQQDDEKP